MIPCKIKHIKDAIANFNPTALEAAQRWLEHVLDACESYGDSEPVLYCHMGSWIDKHFVMPRDADVVLIVGDVVCERYLDDRAPSENTLLLIAGNVQTSALVSCAACVIAGNAVLEYMYVASGNDYQLVLGGDLSVSKAIIENGQNIVCAGIIKSPLIVSYHNEITAAQVISKRYLEYEINNGDIFIDELLQSEKTLEWSGEVWLPTGQPYLSLKDDLLVERICAGLPVLR